VEAVKVQTVRITIDRKTGQTLSTQVLEEKEMDENEYFRPLVEIFGKRILEEMKKQKSSEVGDSDAEKALKALDEGATSS